MKEGIGTFKLSQKGNTGLLYIPAHVVLDSAFPLKEGKVSIEITDEQITVRSIAQEIIKRIGHWERFSRDAEETIRMVKSDPELIRLMELEMELEPMSAECRNIRRQIASLEPCHEHYVENVKAVLGMIGSMTPEAVLDCGAACEARQEEAAAYMEALQTWRDSNVTPENADDYMREVFDLLGKRTDEKLRLLNHLTEKLRDNGYKVYADEDEDFELTESRIQHLEICNFNWKENLRIVLKEIAAGKRLFEWHVPDGYNAHGDCPDRIPELKDMIVSAAAWAQEDEKKAGKWGRILGESTREKRWLAASLCKHVSMQHRKFGGNRLLARPSLLNPESDRAR
ncbi:MAG: hypothetical protein OEZ48_11780 [Candidatus Bathyarchaeota archaeon]|nr:hypothetical protein [Candidatus Bathyarchaeota archaeon]